MSGDEINNYGARCHRSHLEVPEQVEIACGSSERASGYGSTWRIRPRVCKPRIFCLTDAINPFRSAATSHEQTEGGREGEQGNGRRERHGTQPGAENTPSPALRGEASAECSTLVGLVTGTSGRTVCSLAGCFLRGGQDGAVKSTVFQSPDRPHERAEEPSPAVSM